MPYIDQRARGELCGLRAPITPGELNYKITELVDAYLEVHGGVNYSNINACVGVLECAKLELYRRIAAPYEDKKTKENGDVYTVTP